MNVLLTGVIVAVIGGTVGTILGGLALRQMTRYLDELAQNEHRRRKAKTVVAFVALFVIGVVFMGVGYWRRDNLLLMVVFVANGSFLISIIGPALVFTSQLDKIVDVIHAQAQLQGRNANNIAAVGGDLTRLIPELQAALAKVGVKLEVNGMTVEEWQRRLNAGE